MEFEEINSMAKWFFFWLLECALILKAGVKNSLHVFLPDRINSKDIESKFSVYR